MSDRGSPSAQEQRNDSAAEPAATGAPGPEAPVPSGERVIEVETMEPEPGAIDLVGGADDPDTESGRRPSRTRTAVLASLLAAGLAGGAAIGAFWWQIVREKDVALSPPAEVAGLRRDDSAEAKATADNLRTALSAEADLDETVGAVYTDPADPKRSVLVFGGTSVLWTPERDLDGVFGLFADNAGAVTGLHDVPTGRYGGTMKCGTTTSPDGTIAVCGWADHGSMALAMFPDRTDADSAPLMLQLREAMQTRG